MTFSYIRYCGISLLCAAICCSYSWAGQKIAVLDFELNDLTLQPATAQELERTASIAPILREAFMQSNELQIVLINAQTQAEADVGFGYLFEHPNKAAELGAAHGADWVLVGRLHKPSFLFAYLMGRLVHVESAEMLGDYVQEIKGSSRKLTQRGVKKLAQRVSHTISKQSVNK